MQTYSHTILTAVLKEPVEKLIEKSNGRLPPLYTSAILIGSFLPDLLLILISAWAIASDMRSGAFRDFGLDHAEHADGIPPEVLQASKTAQLFELWYFENPWIITAQSLFHSPLLLIVYISFGYWLWKKGRQRGAWFFWLSCAAMLHTLIDIPLHVNDGPLLLFPFNWNLRFESPISYWDPNYYGRQWSRFETLFNIVALIYLFWRYRTALRAWVTSRRNRTPNPSS